MSKYKMPKVEELLEAGVHFGHQVRRWHPKMEPYIYGVKSNIHIINLEDTEKKLKQACEFLHDVASRGGQIVFVGTKKQARDIIELESKRCGALYITERWLGGTVTNFKVIKRNIDKLVDLMKKREAGELSKYTKKERLLIDREIEKLQKYYGGIITLRGVPEAIFVVDSRREKTAVREAQSANVPVVGLIDTNSDPTYINHVIPGNDDAIKSVALILKTVSAAVEEGYKEFASNTSKAEKTEVKEPAKEAVASEAPVSTETPAKKPSKSSKPKKS